MTDSKTQCTRLFNLLKAHEGNWVTLPQILDLHIASHTRRIFELRQQLKPEGYEIQIHDERIVVQRHTKYRLVKVVQLTTDQGWFDEQRA